MKAAATIVTGDALAVLRTLPAGSVQCCVTSPPYWGLRDYGVAGQMGLEPTIDLYVSRLVEVFREARRVLKSDGTLWLNLGDSYATGGGKARSPGGGSQGDQWQGPRSQPNRMPQAGLKPKDLTGIPWRVAFALQADGWWLRSDIVWHKRNPMPESVTDRPTKAHEYLFLLAKSERYLCDMAAIREPRTSTGLHDASGCGYAAPGQRRQNDNRKRSTSGNKARKLGDGTEGRLPNHLGRGIPWEATDEYRNRRTVWTISARPFRGVHFATFPPKLIEPCVLAGSRKGDLVMDPFSGAATTGLVAMEHGRRYLGIELNPEYVAMANTRLGTGRKAVAARGYGGAALCTFVP